MSEIRPLPEDPSGPTVEAMFDIRSTEWFVAAGGDYQTAAVETMKADGSAWQRLVALEWPARVNNSDERRTIRLLIDPDDALGLAQVLAQTALWMKALK